MRILGIDPGLAITGFGVIEPARGGPILVQAGTLKSSGTIPIDKRIRVLYDGIVEILEECQPDCVAIEALFSNYKHPTAALQMAHARGVLMLAAANRNLPVSAYPPARVKVALTGRGQASKAQMQQMIQRVFNLAAPPSPPDVADALAIALCHADALARGPRRGREGKSLPPELAELVPRKRTGQAKKQDILAKLLVISGGTK